MHFMGFQLLPRFGVFLEMPFPMTSYPSPSAMVSVNFDWGGCNPNPREIPDI